MDLQQLVDEFNAEKENVREAANLLAQRYAEAVKAVAELVAMCDPFTARSIQHATALNAEAARRGIKGDAAPMDLAGEFDLALELHGVQMPPELKFSAIGQVGDV